MNRIYSLFLFAFVELHVFSIYIFKLGTKNKMMFVTYNSSIVGSNPTSTTT